MGIASKLAKKVAKKIVKKKPTKKYFMEIEQDKKSSKLVLKVSDSNKKGHVEVRGKLGYEGTGYNPKDKLHKLLDKLDGATIAKLFGTTGKVILNPNNMRTESSLAEVKKILNKYAKGGIIKRK